VRKPAITAHPIRTRPGSRRAAFFPGRATHRWQPLTGHLDERLQQLKRQLFAVRNGT
jgi:hypothetical protein